MVREPDRSMTARRDEEGLRHMLNTEFWTDGENRQRERERGSGG